jgi:hypothetical protein
MQPGVDLAMQQSLRPALVDSVGATVHEAGQAKARHCGCKLLSFGAVPKDVSMPGLAVPAEQIDHHS